MSKRPQWELATEEFRDLEREFPGCFEIQAVGRNVCRVKVYKAVWVIEDRFGEPMIEERTHSGNHMARGVYRLVCHKAMKTMEAVRTHHREVQEDTSRKNEIVKKADIEHRKRRTKIKPREGTPVLSPGELFNRRR